MDDFFRGRRLRRTPGLRRLVREARLSPEQLVLPLFVEEGEGIRRPVSSMPGVDRTSVDGLLEDAREAVELGLGGVMLFGIPGAKDETGSGAWAPEGVVQRGVRALKETFPQLVVITDVCLCEYTSHGHCGVLDEGASDPAVFPTGSSPSGAAGAETPGPRVRNDPTLELLARTAVSHARAGADVVAPSDMMDGRVAAIREALNREGFHHTPILSYAVKYASAFYGPFRDAADSTPTAGDRRSYQMDPANGREALQELWADLEEGADLVMVKPALACLDIIQRVRREAEVPVAAYHVSGEYAAIMAAAERGWLDEEAAMSEALLAIRRAGADIIVTYWARQFARGSRSDC